MNKEVLIFALLSSIIIIWFVSGMAKIADRIITELQYGDDPNYQRPSIKKGLLEYIKKHGWNLFFLIIFIIDKFPA